MKEMDELKATVAHLRAKDGCPWDRQQTHESLKAAAVEEAAEVLCGINILSETGKADNLKEELGDLLLQVVMHAQIAEEEGLFTLEDVIRGINKKMIRRHPHVFDAENYESGGRPFPDWGEIKAKEKKGHEWEAAYLPGAFREAEEMIRRAEKRKGIQTEES